MNIDWSTVPVLKYLWAWWRSREARIRDAEAGLPPVMRRFAVGELVPLKGFVWRISHIGPHGIVLAPIEFTAGQRKRLAKQLDKVQSEKRAEGVHVDPSTDLR